MALNAKVTFAPDVQIDKINLIEVPDNLLTEIMKGSIAVLRGQPEDEAVFCTKSRTYQFRVVENSNTTLLVQRPPPTESKIAGDESSSPAEPVPLTVSSVVTRHFEVLPIHPIVSTIEEVLAGNVFSFAHDRLVRAMAAKARRDANASSSSSSRAKASVTDADIDGLLGGDDSRKKKRRTLINEEEEEEEDERKRNGGSGAEDVALPNGRSIAELLNIVQASEDELVAGLVKKRLFALPPSYFGISEESPPSTSVSLQGGASDDEKNQSGSYAVAIAARHSSRFMLIDPLLVEKITSALIDIVIADNYDIATVDVERLALDLTKEVECSLPTAIHCIDALRADADRISQPLAIPPLHAKFSLAGSGADARVVAFSPDLLATFRATQLLKKKSPFPAAEFEREWEACLPLSAKPTLDMLKGIALRTEVSVLDTAIGRMAMKSALAYFPVIALSAKRTERFAQLFDYMEQWTMEDITPYIKEFTMDTLSLDQLLLKEARAIRSTKLPPGPDGKPIMVYTRR